MAETIPTVPEVISTPIPSLEPVTAPTVVPEAVITVTPTPAPSPAPEPPVALPTAPETLLAEGLDKPKPVEPIPAPVRVADATKDSTQEGQSAETAPPPVVDTALPEPVPPKYDPWTLPEGVNLQEDRIGKFTELLSDLELSGKASHEVVQQFGQKAVDFYLEEVKTYGENLTKYYQTTWEKQKQSWKEATLKDIELGGNRIQTTLDSVLGFIRTHGGTADQQKEFRDVMETSGLGNHPAVIRVFANAALAYKEGKPLAAPKPVQEVKSKTETLYGKRA